MKILKTGKATAGSKHYHLIYVDEKQQKLAVCWEGKGKNFHTHDIITTPEGGISLSTAEDGHTHYEIEVYEDSYPKRPEVDDEEVIKNTLGLAKVAYEDSEVSFKMGLESEDFYLGNQWEKQIKEELVADGRACLVINYTQKNIDSLVGYHRQQRSDVRFLPVEDGDQIACDIMNTVYKTILNQNNYEFEESAIFEDMAIAGRGCFNVWVDFEQDPRGDIKVERYSWDNVIYGPHEKLDASDAEYVVKYQYQSIRKLKSQWPDKAGEFDDWISLATRDRSIFDKPTEPHTTYATDQYAESGETRISTMLAQGFNLLDVAKKEVCVLECQQKVYLPCVVVYDSSTEEAKYFFGLSQSDQKQLKTIPGLTLIPRQQKKIRLTKLAGGVLLEDSYPAELALDDFHIIPSYGKKRRNKFWGRVEIGKDPQRETNKRLSQSIDVVNFASLYGFIIDPGTFASAAEEKNFRDNATKPGFVVKAADSNNPPKMIQGIKVPSEVLTMAEASESRLERLQGLEATRFAGANTSSAAILQAEKSGLMSSEGYFDNISLSKKKVAKLVVAMIQKYYSPKRLVRILESELSRSDFPVAGMPMSKYDITKIEAILENTDLTKFDIAIGEAAWTPTQKMATAQMLTEMMSQGAPVPFEVLAKAMDMPENIREELIQGSLAQQQAQSQSSSQTYDMEIQKSLIGQGIIPEEVKQKYGIGGPAPGQLELPQESGENNLPPGLYGASPGGL